jgi:hypothetical protein
MTTGEPVLKSDTRGRVRMPAEQREALLDEFETSGVSGMKFAALAGVKYATFANWIQRRRKQRAEARGSGTPQDQPGASVESQAVRPVRLLEAFGELGRTPPSSALRVELPGGAKLLVDSPGQLRLAAELLQMLHSTGRRREC